LALCGFAGVAVDADKLTASSGASSGGSWIVVLALCVVADSSSGDTLVLGPGGNQVLVAVISARVASNHSAQGGFLSLIPHRHPLFGVAYKYGPFGQVAGPVSVGIPARLQVRVAQSVAVLLSRGIDYCGGIRVRGASGYYASNHWALGWLRWRPPFHHYKSVVGGFLCRGAWRGGRGQNGDWEGQVGCGPRGGHCILADGCLAVMFSVGFVL